MGVQPRTFSVTDEMNKSPAMTSASSPASRKRRYVDVVLSSEKRHSVDDEEAEEAQLNKRVSFKRSKSGENGLRVIVHSTRSQRESNPLASPTSKVDTPKSKLSPSKARPNMSASQTITLEMLRPHFEKPLAQVALIFSICVTLLKKICRKNGLARWPHRQIIGLRKSISSMEQAIGHFEGARRDSYAQQLDKQRNKLAALLEDPTKCNLLAADDDYTTPAVPAHQPVNAHVYQHPSPPAGYAPYPAPPTYERGYTQYAPSEYAHPHMYHQPEDHHQHQPYPSYAYQAPPPTYAHPPEYMPRAPPSVSLPPLRIENRQTLPSLSTVVGRRWY